MSEKRKAKGGNGEGPKVVWGGFDAGEAIGAELIRKEHHHLAEARIRYICRNFAAKQGETKIPGGVYKITGRNEYMLECDFVIEVALEVWNDYQPNQRRALIDHYLTRCVCVENEKTGAKTYKLRKPPIQEFPEVAERNGQWNEDLVEMAKCLK